MAGLQHTDLGSCCRCGKYGKSVRNILMIHQLAPTPGTGWGCVVCGLPTNGAVAVMCDACMYLEPLLVCVGYPYENVRRKIEFLADVPFDHDLSKHSKTPA